MNQPLPLNAAGEPDFSANYGVGSFAQQIEAGDPRFPAARSDVLLLVAFSGGGKRSAAFAHGALRGLRAIPVRPQGQEGWTMLDDVDYFSGVSGGSFPIAHYGLYRARHFETFTGDFLKRDINAFIYGIYLFPWRWDWLVNPLVGTNDYMAEIYDRLMFHGATYADLARQGPPLISVNATDITNEISFPFLGTTFGLLCSDLNGFPIARAVAASNGFPILFSPITLENHAARCAGRRPPDAAPAAWAAPESLVSRRAELARIADAYVDPETTRFVHLMDGGIVDNLALRGLMNLLVRLDASDEIFRITARHMRRIVILSIDGEAAPDRSLGRQRVVTGIGQIFAAVSGTQIDSYNFETLSLAQEKVAALVQGFREVRCREARIVNGHRCDDVEGRFVHVSLANIGDAEMRARLQAIPTGLTIPDADVDALVEYGERLIGQHPDLRAVAAAADAVPVEAVGRPAATGQHAAR